VGKSSHPPGLDSRTVQPVATPYTDRAISANDVAQGKKKKVKAEIRALVTLTRDESEQSFS